MMTVFRDITGGRWLAAAGMILLAVSFMAAFGYGESFVATGVAVAAGLAAAVVGVLLWCARPLRSARGPAAATGAAIALVVAVLAAASHGDGAAKWMDFFQVGSVARLIALVVHGYAWALFLLAAPWRLIDSSVISRRPARTLVLVLTGVILWGTVLMSLPAALPGGVPPSTALLTAISAATGTGAQFITTAELTHSGQFFVLLIFELGALAMLLVVGIALLNGGGRTPAMIARRVIVVAASAQCAGTLLLFMVLPRDEFSVMRRGFIALFHAASAFCNSGFSVYQRGLEPFYSDVVTGVTVMALVIVGGLGSIVLCSARRARPLVMATAVVVPLGALLLWWSAGGHMSAFEATFASVSLRTAGFTMVQPGEWSGAARVVATVLMLMGAAPASAAGGLYLTTFMVGAVALGRRRNAVRWPAYVFLLSAFVMALSFVLLLRFEPDGVHFMDVVSAYTTAGVTLSPPASLSLPGRIVLAGTMLAGRLAPALLMIIFVAGRKDGRDGTSS